MTWGRHLTRRASALVLGLALLTLPAPGHAFTTRVHIVLANQIRLALIESGDGTIALRWSEHSVRLPPEDADAIINQPLAFRAGAIGPDNVVFPAMTDASHGVEQDPYRQCELLYEAAITEVERAYALGCFLHGASDAIAHHYVNHATGETFTLNPVSASRLPSWDNVTGHITTESVIQSSIHAADPDLFTAGQLAHTLPRDFILRTYFDVDSPLWQRLSEHGRARFEAARAADPDGNLLTWVAAADLAAWEQIALSPLYIDEIQRARVALRAWILSEIADMADPFSTRGAQLGVTPGLDGMVGTPDDDTACAASCPSLAGQYYVYVNVLAPRFDAAGRELPSAFDALSDDLGAQLYRFLPALVGVIDNVSAALNAPIPASDTQDHGFDVTPAQITTLFMPMTDWANTLIDTTETGFDGLADSVTPDWYSDLSDFLLSLDIDITIGNVLRIVFRPIIDEIRDTLVNEVRTRAEGYLDELTTEYQASFDGWDATVHASLDVSAPLGLGGHALDFALDSGLIAYSFNITAASLANHEVLLLPEGVDPIGNGPASFDASYTHEWTQLGACSYLRDAVFPEGTSVAALLSVVRDEAFYGSPLAGDTPVECHAGSLDEFGTPSPLTCAHTTLDALLDDPTGSLSRAFPPAHASGEPGCRRLVVPGLPDPPPLPVEDGGVDMDGGTQMQMDAGTDPGTDGGTTPPVDGGCGCSSAGRSSGAPWLLLVGLALLLRRRSGRGRSPAMLGALALMVAGCDPAPAVEDAGRDAGQAERDGSTSDMDAHVPDMDGGTDAAMEDPDGGPPDGGPNLRRELIDALAGTVWSDVQTREDGRARIYEHHFSADLRWGEIRNPWGPGRQRVLRAFNVMTDGLTVTSTIMIPTGWETPESLRGRAETWEIEVRDGTPRELVLTNTETGEEDIYTEGPWPAPTSGLTAEVRVFGSTGAGHGPSV